MTGTAYSHVVGIQLGEGLRALQFVRPFDYQAADSAVYAGSSFMRPWRDRYDAAWFQGRALALALWQARMKATLELREGD